MSGEHAIRKVLRILVSILFSGLLLVPPLLADTRPVYLGLDGEFGLLNSTSAQAVERGILTAIDEINASGGVLGGRPLELLTKDNRSVPSRGQENIRQFAEVPDLVAVIGGRFSPVLLDEVALVHELGIPLLASWSSAEGIINHGYRPSYTFRLSLRDSFAMPVMLKFALSRGAKRIGLLVPNTGWGRSNAEAAMQFAEKMKYPVLLEPIWYNWGEKDMLRHYRQLLDQGMDALVLVANDLEGALLVRQLESTKPLERVPIISHWGVTGGKMVERSGPFLHQIDFSVVQTFSLFTAPPDIRERVLKVSGRLFGLHRPEDILSPVGFGHAYDLTHILSRAVDIAGSTDWAKVRDALEQVRDYRGLTGEYPQPFTAERHEAMTIDQVFMARYREDGVIVPITEDSDSQ